MAGVTRKTFLKVADGTPKKRFFLSIISDYGLKTGLCELVDNAIDHWVAQNMVAPLEIKITLDPDRQLIRVFDNAGGVSDDDAELLVSPGASSSALGEARIGIFGVGGKRAGVALGELVEIRTRRGRGKSIQVDLTTEWIETPDWGIEVHEIPDIEPGTTTVDISKIRQSFSQDDVEDLRQHLSETYAWFLDRGCEIWLNGDAVTPATFEQWAYPPEYLPRHAAFKVEPARGQFLDVEIIGGLILDRIPDSDALNYGVYFVCNHRLIVKELKVRDVGYFVPSEAGVPHPDASYARVIVTFSGAADLMPWISSKSGINYSHPAFLAVRQRVIDFIAYYSKVSRALKFDREGQITKYTSGEILEVPPGEAESAKKKVMPRPPSSRKPSRYEQTLATNRKLLNDNPWVLGLVEAMGMVDLIAGQKKFQTRNRAALILLDSNFEIALKEFITHRKDLFSPSKFGPAQLGQLFMQRTSVINEVTKHVTLPKILLGKINHYYDLRNNLIHQRATVPISDVDVDDYREVIEKVLKKLFDLKFPADA